MTQRRATDGDAVSTVEARKYLGAITGRNTPLPRRTLGHWLNKGLPHRRIGRSLFFNAGELVRWVESHKKGASYGV